MRMTCLTTWEVNVNVQKKIVKVFHKHCDAGKTTVGKLRSLSEDYESVLVDSRHLKVVRYVLGFVDEYQQANFESGEFPVFLKCGKVYMISNESTYHAIGSQLINEIVNDQHD